MTNDLLVKIDTLIEMSKSTSNYDTIKAEKSEIEESIELKTKELDDLKATMQDEKYMKASDRIIDENIKVSLELKIQKLESNYRKTERDLKAKINDETVQHEKVNENKHIVERLSNLIMTLREKLDSLSDEEIIKSYQNLLHTNEQRLEMAKQAVTESESEYQTISRELTSLTDKLDQITKEIESEKEKLKSTLANLSTNDTYIDKERKNEDEQRRQELEKELEELENRKKEIEKDPVVIGNIAKELYIEEDYAKCMAKVTELVKYIKTLPFMDIASSNDIKKILKDAENAAIAERDDFASAIESKKYNGSDATIVLERQKYLETKRQELEDELLSAKNSLRKMDTTKFQELNTLLSAATIVQETLKNDLVEYKKVIEEEKEVSTPKKMNTLNAALKKKEEELSTVEEIINEYENEIEELMIESKKLQEEKIYAIEINLEKVENDIKEISKKVVISTKANDILALESDKTKLKELNDKIKSIADRKKYEKTPSELLDEIEMTLGSPKEEKQSVPSVEEKGTDDYRIVEDIDLPSDSKKEIDMPSIDESFEISFDEEDKVEKTADSNEPSMDEFIPKRKEEKLKVTDIETLDETKKDKEESFDFEDDDYIDFDAIIEGN